MAIPRTDQMYKFVDMDSSSSLSNVPLNVPMPNSSNDLPQTLHVGMRFASIDQARTIIKHWAKANKAPYAVRKSESRCWLLVCKDQNCKFRIRVKAGGVPQISILSPHSCPDYRHLDWRLPYTQPHFDPSLRKQIMNAAKLDSPQPGNQQNHVGMNGLCQTTGHDLDSERNGWSRASATDRSTGEETVAPQSTQFRSVQAPVTSANNNNKNSSSSSNNNSNSNSNHQQMPSSNIAEIECSWHNINNSGKGFSILKKRCAMSSDKVVIAIGNDVAMGDYSVVNVSLNERSCLIVCSSEKTPDTMRSWPLWTAASEGLA